MQSELCAAWLNQRAHDLAYPIPIDFMSSGLASPLDRRAGSKFSGSSSHPSSNVTPVIESTSPSAHYRFSKQLSRVIKKNPLD